MSLRNVKTIKYLGSEFGDLNGHAHLNNRSVASNRAFYGIQTAGVKYPDLNINVVSDIYNINVVSDIYNINVVSDIYNINVVSDIYNFNVVSDIYKTAVESVLQFGCSSIYPNKGNISKLNQLQGKLIKNVLAWGNGVAHTLC